MALPEIENDSSDGAKLFIYFASAVKRIVEMFIVLSREDNED